MTAQVMDRDGLAVVGDRYAVGGPAMSERMEAWVRGERPGRMESRPDRERRRVDWSRVRGDAGMLAALGLVNGFAVHGQALWALKQFASGIVVAVLFACALESVSLYLQAAAHRARIAGDAALLRLAASYGIGALVGWLNWSHWADTNPARGAAYAAFSVLSPMLWAIRSKDNRRDALRAAGLIDPRAVRFAPVRWVLYPARTFRAFRAAVGEGVQDPQKAWALTAPAPAPVDVDAEAPAPQPVHVTVQAADTPAPAVAPQIAVPGPKTPRPSQAPARPTTPRKAPAGQQAATDDDILRIARGVIAVKPGAGRITVGRAIADAGFRPGAKDRIDRAIKQLREEQP